MRPDFGRTATDYSTHRAGFPSAFFERLSRHLGKRGGRPPVLDLATGTGSVARGLATRGFEVVALDRRRSWSKRRRCWDAAAGVDIEYLVGEAGGERAARRQLRSGDHRPGLALVRSPRAGRGDPPTSPSRRSRRDRSLRLAPPAGHGRRSHRTTHPEVQPGVDDGRRHGTLPGLGSRILRSRGSWGSRLFFRSPGLLLARSLAGTHPSQRRNRGEPIAGARGRVWLRA